MKKYILLTEEDIEKLKNGQYIDVGMNDRINSKGRCIHLRP